MLSIAGGGVSISGGVVSITGGSVSVIGAVSLTGAGARVLLNNVFSGDLPAQVVGAANFGWSGGGANEWIRIGTRVPSGDFENVTGNTAIQALDAAAYTYGLLSAGSGQAAWGRIRAVSVAGGPALQVAVHAISVLGGAVTVSSSASVPGGAVSVAVAASPSLGYPVILGTQSTFVGAVSMSRGQAVLVQQARPSIFGVYTATTSIGLTNNGTNSVVWVLGNATRVDAGLLLYLRELRVTPGASRNLTNLRLARTTASFLSMGIAGGTLWSGRMKTSYPSAAGVVRYQNDAGSTTPISVSAQTGSFALFQLCVGHGTLNDPWPWSRDPLDQIVLAQNEAVCLVLEGTPAATTGVHVDARWHEGTGLDD